MLDNHQYRYMRTRWYAKDLTIKDEPLILSLIKYRMKKDRIKNRLRNRPNLISSNYGKQQLPIIDLDFPHEYVPSSSEGHGHLYLNVPISKWRWIILQLALRVAKVTETGFMVWSLRRGGNFVRISPEKTEEETPKSQYGWFRKLKEYR